MTAVMLAADDDGAVRISPALVAQLAPILRKGARLAVRDGLRLTPLVVATINAFTAAERSQVAQAQPDHPQPAAIESSSAQGDRHLLVRDVAREVGVSPQAVRRAAKELRLIGRRLGGEWQFTADDVAAWQRTRSANGGSGDDDQA